MGVTNDNKRLSMLTPAGTLPRALLIGVIQRGRYHAHCYHIVSKGMYIIHGTLPRIAPLGHYFLCKYFRGISESHLLGV